MGEVDYTNYIPKSLTNESVMDGETDRQGQILMPLTIVTRGGGHLRKITSLLSKYRVITNVFYNMPNTLGVVVSPNGRNSFFSYSPIGREWFIYLFI